MSDLTKRLPDRLRVHYNMTADDIAEEAADRIEALEECLLEFIAEHDNAALDQPGAKTLILHWARNNDMISKARALLEEK